MYTNLFVLCAVLGLSDFAVSISRLSSDETDSNYIDDGSKYEIQRDIEAPKWKNIFKLPDTDAVATNASELFTFSQLTAVPTKQVSGVIRYSIGKRLSNDRLVAHSANSQRWAVPHDVTLALRYPSSGQGALVTYAEVIVDQSSNIGQAHVIDGGIGQRSIAVAVEAKNTLWFSYSANFYGL